MNKTPEIKINIKTRRVYESDEEIKTPHWITIPPKDK